MCDVCYVRVCVVCVGRDGATLALGSTHKGSLPWSSGGRPHLCTGYRWPKDCALVIGGPRTAPWTTSTCARCWTGYTGSGCVWQCVCVRVTVWQCVCVTWQCVCVTVCVTCVAHGGTRLAHGTHGTHVQSRCGPSSSVSQVSSREGHIEESHRGVA